MRIFKIIFLSCVCLLSINAQESKLIIGGFLEYDHISYFENLENKINGRNQSTIRLDLESKLASNFKLYSSVDFRNDLNDASRNRLQIKEAYTDLRYSNFDIRVGQQIITWGKADGINPTDILNPVDLTDILDTDDETLGIIALNTKYYIGDWSVQGIFVPVFTPGILPLDPQNRWNNNLVDQIRAQSPFEVTIPVFESDKPYNDLRSSQYAGAISGGIYGVDVSLHYYNGYNHIPELETALLPVSSDTALVSIVQKYYKHQMLGGAFSTGIGYWGIRGEGAYYIPTEIRNDAPYFQYVVGIDRVFSNVIGSNNLFIIAQWIHEIAEGDAEFSNLNLNHLFQKNIMARMELELGTLSQISLQGLYNLEYADYYLQLEAEHNLADGLNLLARLDMLDGGADSFFHVFKHNDRIQLILKYNF